MRKEIEQAIWSPLTESAALHFGEVLLDSVCFRDGQTWHVRGTSATIRLMSLQASIAQVMLVVDRKAVCVERLRFASRRDRDAALYEAVRSKVLRVGRRTVQARLLRAAEVAR